jgi:hypothetical protein
MPRVHATSIQVGLHLGQTPIERLTAGTEMRPHHRAPVLIVGAVDLELGGAHHPAGGQPATRRPGRGIPPGVAVVEIEQHRHRLHRDAAGLEVRANIHQPRQPRCAVLTGLARQLHTAGAPLPGPLAGTYAWPRSCGLTGFTFGRCDRAHRAVTCATPPRKPGTHTRNDRDHVAHHIIGGLTGMGEHDPAAEHRLHTLHPQPRQPIPIIHRCLSMPSPIPRLWGIGSLAIV